MPTKTHFGVIHRVEGGLTYTQTFDADREASRRGNRLVSVTVGGQTTQFVYDGDGNPSTGSRQARPPAQGRPRQEDQAEWQPDPLPFDYAQGKLFI